MKRRRPPETLHAIGPGVEVVDTSTLPPSDRPSKQNQKASELLTLVMSEVCRQADGTAGLAIVFAGADHAIGSSVQVSGGALLEEGADAWCERMISELHAMARGLEQGGTSRTLLRKLERLARTRNESRAAGPLRCVCGHSAAQHSGHGLECAAKRCSCTRFEGPSTALVP